MYHSILWLDTWMSHWKQIRRSRKYREKVYKCKECEQHSFFQCSENPWKESHREKPYECKNVRCQGGTQLFKTHGTHTGDLLSVRNVRKHSFIPVTHECTKAPTKGHKPSYKCTECGKTFESPETIEIHERIHEGRKTYECKQCGAFKRLSPSRHTKDITREYSFVCKTCSKVLNTAWSLRNHERIHTGENHISVRNVVKPLIECNPSETHDHAHWGWTL